MADNFPIDIDYKKVNGILHISPHINFLKIGSMTEKNFLKTGLLNIKR